MSKGRTGGESAWEWLYGIVPVEEALKVGRRAVRELWVSFGRRDGRIERLLGMARGIDVHWVSVRELDLMARGGNHQGVMAKVDPLPREDMGEILEGQGPVLALEGIQDPRNLGAIIRSAVAMGAPRVVVERRHAVSVTATAAKAACGGLEHARMCIVPNLPRFLRKARLEDYWVVGTADTGGMPLWEAQLPERVVVVVGGEGAGLRRVVRSQCDVWVTIPWEGPIGTYNASVAASVVLYELMRRRFEARDGSVRMGTGEVRSG